MVWINLIERMTFFFLFRVQQINLLYSVCYITQNTEEKKHLLLFGPAITAQDK